MKILSNIIGTVLLASACSGCITRTVALGAAGKVLDSHTRAPLQGCSVSVTGLSGQGRVVRTGADGAFDITSRRRLFPVFLMGDFWPSRYLLVNRVGYETATLDLSMQQSDLEVLLSPV